MVISAKDIRSRAYIKGQLTKNGTFLKSLPENLAGIDVRSIEGRYKLFSTLLTKFDEVQTKIEQLASDSEAELKAQGEERRTFEDEFFDLDSKFLTLIDSLKAGGSGGLGCTTEMSLNGMMPGRIRLPQIKLPEFDGCLTDYIPFIDLFDSLVHSNPELSNVDKLLYLRASLKGDALKLIESLPTTSGNYQQARNLIDGRYNNIRCIKQAHLRALFELDEVKGRSISSLRALVDHAQKNLSALKALNEDVDAWDTILVYLITSKLDNETRRQFELTYSNQDEPTFGELNEFLIKRCAALERFEFGGQRPTRPTIVEGHRANRLERTVGLVVSKPQNYNGYKCNLCGGKHSLVDCAEFLKLSASERYKRAKSEYRCINCLRVGHKAKDCRSAGCMKCNLKHNSLLHFNDFQRKTEGTDIKMPSKELIEGGNNSVSLQSSMEKKDLVLLFTAIVMIRSANGIFMQARALIDSGSQANFVSNELVNRLGYKVDMVKMNVNGIGGRSSVISSVLELEYFSLHSKLSMTGQFYVLDRITTELPQREFSIDLIESDLKDLKLADPWFYKPGRIDLLLSNEAFAKLMIGGSMSLRNGLTAFESHLGWIVGGKGNNGPVKNYTDEVLCSLMTEIEEPLDLKKFWELEMVGCEDKNRSVEAIVPFSEVAQRDEEGRFIAKLPFKKELGDLSYSREYALNRFIWLERKFRKDASFQQSYAKTIKEYIHYGFIERVERDDKSEMGSYYLPHHAVFKESSLTTKLRVVFDGSSAPRNCQPINSMLDTGVKLQNDLVRSLMRFRTCPIAFIADIEKMYHQIKIAPEHRNFLRIFWRFSEDQKLETFRLTTLPFGLNCSPNIAIRCLKELARGFLDTYPEASQVLIMDSYMDDILTGAESVEKACQLIKDLIMICKSGGFKLRKWTSNNENVLQSISEFTNDENESFAICKDESNVLGLRWKPKDDVLTFSFNWSIPKKLTKRGILSFLAGLFDPMGLISPVIIVGKILLQKLWILQLDWDQELPESLTKEYLLLFDEIVHLRSLQLPRFVGDVKNAQLYAFCDASEKAYGAAVYLKKGTEAVLVFAKSRVAPLKTVSLARLELCAAVICARAVNYVANAFGIKLSDCVLWTDSRIVLAWIKKPSYSWKCFVANRVSEIQETTMGCRWSHVKSADNPADLISRGCSPLKLKSSKLWWKGPEWITATLIVQEPAEFIETELELRKVVNLVNIEDTFLSYLYSRISCYSKLIGTVGWMIRFKTNCLKSKSVRLLDNHLSPLEFQLAENIIVKMVQTVHFKNALCNLKSGKPLCKNESLVDLNPFLDADGLLRVGGRLKNSNLAYDTKHPLILPKLDKFVDMLIRWEHFRCNHIGVNGLIGTIRLRFWIINIRTVVKRVISKCLICFRFCPKPGKQQLGSLPKERVEVVRPFFRVGVDLCGPFLVRPTQKRGNSTHSVYVALFVCLPTKAIHTEVVFSLSAVSFIAAFRRFISRRGIPQIVMSDNATNFKGTANYLKEWQDLKSLPEFQERIQAEFVAERITWKFIPPRSPNFGGIWEAQIKSLKSSLLKTARNCRFTYEEFSTLLGQVEASLNARPLGLIKNDNGETLIITPSHFLIGDHIKALPCLGQEEFHGALGIRWQKVQDMFNVFWKIWSTDYLTELNGRRKWKVEQENIKVDDIGILLDENYPPLTWPLCRVIQVHPGSDGLVRVVTIKVGNTQFKRSISRFCKLPYFSNSEMCGSNGA